jgi:hypothetical protein
MITSVVWEGTTDYKYQEDTQMLTDRVGVVYHHGQQRNELMHPQPHQSELEDPENK